MKYLISIAVSVVVASGTAAAQPADPTPPVKLPVARRLYDEGVEAAGNGQWATAHDRFKASYELAPRVLTLFNLAGAQGQTGRLVEASENYRRFLRDASNGKFADLRADATAQLDLIEKQLAHATLEVANLESGDLVTIDDIEFPPVALREPIALNPGQHVARVQRGTTVVASRTVSIASGASEVIRIELRRAPPDLTLHRDDVPRTVGPLVARDPPSPPRKRSWLRSPWLWSGVAIVVAGGAAGAYFMTRPDVVVVR